MRINEIFYSVQGEGYFTGTPAVFIRFSGCNLNCPFCDTEHQHYRELTIEKIIDEISSYPAKHAIITGGEPSLQVTGEFIEALHRHGYFVQAETNGTKRLPDNIDWITCSPKAAPVDYEEVDELKVVFIQPESMEMDRYEGIKAKIYSLQPCDTGDPVRNKEIVEDAISYVKRNPKWRLSLQMHKMLNIR